MESVQAPGSRTRVDGGYIIAFDGNEHRLLRNGVVVYEGDTIVHVGQSYDGPADRTIDARDNVVAPGFISMHSHLSSSPLSKSFREDVGNPNFWMSGLYEFLTPVSEATTPEMARATVRYSGLELLRSGITTIVDLTRDPEDSAEMAGAIGMRAYVGPFYTSARCRAAEGRRLAYDWLSEAEEEEGFQRAIELVEQLDGSHDGRVRGMMAPDFIDTCRPELLERTVDAAERLNVPVQIHAAEAVIEFHEIVRRHGKTPIQLLDAVGMLRPSVIIGHCFFTSGHSWLGYPRGNDLELVARGGGTVAHSAWPFMRYGQALESFRRYADAGIRMSLGTDTFPQSILFEMRIAAVMGKLAERNTEAVTAADVFNAATLGASDGLGRADLGRLGVGTKADFVLYRTDTLSMSPLRDPIKNLVYSALPSDVTHVVVAGQDVLRDGVVPGFEEAVLARDLQRAAEHIWAATPQHDWAGRTADELSPPSIPDWSE